MPEWRDVICERPSTPSRQSREPGASHYRLERAGWGVLGPRSPRAHRPGAVPRLHGLGSVMSKMSGYKCDSCGLHHGPDAIGLVTWLTLVIGARRLDGGGHEDDKDFCSQSCLERFLRAAVLDTTHPYQWREGPAS
jgi:hypothetical protein